jgi:hypothetical protein
LWLPVGPTVGYPVGTHAAGAMTGPAALIKVQALRAQTHQGQHLDVTTGTKVHGPWVKFESLVAWSDM